MSVEIEPVREEYVRRRRSRGAVSRFIRSLWQTHRAGTSDDALPHANANANATIARKTGW
ncbi:Uncharacterised protein [Mycobacteroides abscessus subsp. abscessus]|nr:Uncharacterised protein [Mycobacteroides abscessus subsp. abscessus]